MYLLQSRHYLSNRVYWDYGNLDLSRFRFGI
jgi:hypothetical protein